MGLLIERAPGQSPALFTIADLAEQNGPRMYRLQEATMPNCGVVPWLDCGAAIPPNEKRGNRFEDPIIDAIPAVACRDAIQPFGPHASHGERALRRSRVYCRG